jgi:hypothetical protein
MEQVISGHTLYAIQELDINFAEAIPAPPFDVD